MFLHVNLRAGPYKKTDTWKDVSTATHFVLTSRLGSISLRKRRAYPGTYVRVNGPVAVFGYGSREAVITTDHIPSDQEFLQCQINLATGSLSIQRDVFCTLRLFYSATDTTFTCSDDLAELTKTATIHCIDEKALADELFLLGWSERTLFKGVSLLGPASRIDWQKGAVQYERMAIREAAMPGDAHAFKQNFEATLAKYWHLCGHEQAGFETSGGIDSSTMPFYIAKTHPEERLTIGSMQFHKSFGESQAQKLIDIADTVNGELFTSQLDTKRQFPLARYVMPKYSPRPFYHYQEIYTEALAALARAFVERGVEVVFTGIGGDELFENNTRQVTDKRNQRSRGILEKSTYFMTDAHKLFNTYQKVDTQGYSGVLAESAFIAGQSRNNVYIDHGIWPVAPLADPPLFNYCQRLPIAFRANKNILRGYHEAHHMPRSIYQPSQNEHFGAFFKQSVRQNYADVLEVLLRKSVLHKLGLIDPSSVMATFQRACETDDADKYFFDLYRIAGIEINLQSLSDQEGRYYLSSFL